MQGLAPPGRTCNSNTGGSCFLMGYALSRGSQAEWSQEEEGERSLKRLFWKAPKAAA